MVALGACTFVFVVEVLRIFATLGKEVVHSFDAFLSRSLSQRRRFCIFSSLSQQDCNANFGLKRICRDADPSPFAAPRTSSGCPPCRLLRAAVGAEKWCECHHVAVGDAFPILLLITKKWFCRLFYFMPIVSSCRRVTSKKRVYRVYRHPFLV